MIDNLKQINKDFFEYYWITKLRLFGSFARWDNSPNSDVDLLYEYNPDKDQSFSGIYGLAEELQKKLKHPVELANINLIKDNVRYEILSSKIQII